MEGEYLSLDTAKKIAEKDKEIERLNNIINELEKCIKDKYYEAIDFYQHDLIHIKPDEIVHRDYV